MGGVVVRVRLVSFDASKITRFLFVAARRREIAGASELITYLDRVWVREALRGLCDGFDERWRIEERPVELLATGAGTARVLVREEDLGRRLVTAVTLAALRQAPGLDVCGAVGAPFAWAEEGALHQACVRGVAELARARALRPSVEARHLRLPPVDECSSTGLPAEALVERVGEPGRSEALSAESRAKWAAYGRTGEGEGLARMAALASTDPRELGAVVEQLGERSEWVGVVYADGNGLGRVFGDFSTYVQDQGNRAYADTLRGFTAGLQECAEQAFSAAVAEAGEQTRGTHAPQGRPAPVLPLILGGDDVVAVCEGTWALPFTRAYLAAYERLTGQNAAVAGPLGRHGGPGRVASSAGVAIVKSHFPYVAAAGLAEELMREAKLVKRRLPEQPCSGLSFHVLYDSSGVDLARIRDGSRVGDAALVAQPYVVSEHSGDGPDGWARGRRWSDLRSRVAALSATDEDGERLLPAASMHELREGLFAGPRVADARLANLRPRLKSPQLTALCGEGESLFWPQEPFPAGAVPGERAEARRVTGLLDAMAAAPFLPAEGGAV